MPSHNSDSQPTKSLPHHYFTHGPAPVVLSAVATRLASWCWKSFCVILLLQLLFYGIFYR